MMCSKNIHKMTSQLTATPGTKVTIKDLPELRRVKPIAISTAITVPMLKSVLDRPLSISVGRASTRQRAAWEGVRVGGIHRLGFSDY